MHFITDDFGPAQVVLDKVLTTAVDVSWGISREVDALGYQVLVIHVGTAQEVQFIYLGRGITRYTVNDLVPGNLYEIIVNVDGSDEQGAAKVRTRKYYYFFIFFSCGCLGFCFSLIQGFRHLGLYHHQTYKPSCLICHHAIGYWSMHLFQIMIHNRLFVAIVVVSGS